MTSYRTTIVSTLSSAEAFDYLARFTSTAEWDPGIVEAEQLTPDPVGVGSEFRVVVSAGLARLPLVYRVEEYERPNRVVLEARHPLLTSRDTVTVESAAEGSAVTYAAELHLPGPLRLFDPIAQRVFRVVGDRAARGLRVALTPVRAAEVR